MLYPYPIPAYLPGIPQGPLHCYLQCKLDWLPSHIYFSPVFYPLFHISVIIITIIAPQFMGLSVLSYLFVLQIRTSVLTYIQLHWIFLTKSSPLLRLFICVMACFFFLASFSTSFLIVMFVHILSLVLHFVNLFHQLHWCITLNYIKIPA